MSRYFDYLFYIDFEASMAEIRAQNALAHLQVRFLFFIHLVIDLLYSFICVLFVYYLFSLLSL